MMSAARGVARYLSGGTAIPLGFGAGGAPESVRAIAGVARAVRPRSGGALSRDRRRRCTCYLSRTRAGRYLYAIGDNETAARLSGVRVGWHKALGVRHRRRARGARRDRPLRAARAGQSERRRRVRARRDRRGRHRRHESHRAASGTVGGTLVGMLIIGVINNIMGLNNVDANLQLILKGASSSARSGSSGGAGEAGGASPAHGSERGCWPAFSRPVAAALAAAVIAAAVRHACGKAKSGST